MTSSVTACVLFLCLALAPMPSQGQGFIDRGNCVITGVGHGDNAVCPENFAAVAACGSAEGLDCNDGTSHSLTCCRITGPLQAHTSDAKPGCETWGSSPGDLLECSANYFMLELCASGAEAGCGGSISQEIACCDNTALTVSPLGCTWSYGGPGRRQVCADNEVMTGFCGSGSGLDCPNASSFAVKCCSLVN